MSATVDFHHFIAINDACAHSGLAFVVEILCTLPMGDILIVIRSITVKTIAIMVQRSFTT